MKTETTTTAQAAKVSRNMNRQALRYLRRGETDNAARIIAPVYVADLVDSIDPTAYEATAETDREKVAFFLSAFRGEFWSMYEAERAGSCTPSQSALPGIVAKGVAEYLRGLPSVIAVRYWDCEMLEDARAKGFSIPETLESEFIDAIWAAYGYALVSAALKLKVELPTATA